MVTHFKRIDYGVPTVRQPIPAFEVESQTMTSSEFRS
jgi:hypothetical protein